MSYGSFQAWLDSFVAPTIGNQTNVKERSSQLRDPEDSSLRFSVSGLSKSTDSEEVSAVENIELEPSDFLYKAIQILHERGYEKVCGFRQNGKLIAPLIRRGGKFPVTVTSEESSYSFVAGLKINQDEPLEQFYDNLVRAGEGGLDVTPMSISQKASTNRISIVDSSKSGDIDLEISLDRTLRVPENGVAYDVPGLFGPFPLFDAATIKRGLLSNITHENGFVIPTFPREALALTFHGKFGCRREDFAIKILSRSMNTISGHTPNIDTEGKKTQDHIIAPAQTRLDGFFASSGMVRQFVAMPMGVTYTAEAQLTQKELLGGIQLVIAPRFKGQATFSQYKSQDKTLRVLGLSPGDRLLVEGDELCQREGDFDFDQPTTEFSILQINSLIQNNRYDFRPAFAHELIDLTNHRERLQSFPPIIDAVAPLLLRIEVRPLENFVTSNHNYIPTAGRKKPGTCFTEEVSPFANANHLYKVTENQCGVYKIVLFKGLKVVRADPTLNVPLHEVLGNCKLLFCECFEKAARNYSMVYREAPDTRPSMYSGALSEIPDFQHKKEIRRRRARTVVWDWDLGLAVGGGLCQDITQDDVPERWNWKKITCYRYPTSQ